MRALIGLLLVMLGAAGLAGCTSKSADAPPLPETPAATSTAATATPTPPLTGEEILRRSDEAMRGIAIITESLAWDARDGGPETELPVVAYQHEQRTVILSGDTFGAGCRELARLWDQFAMRSKGGAWSDPGARLGGTAPETVEVLAETTLDGRAAWIIRFRYFLGGYEGRIPREHTEWVAKDDFRLLRAENETVDNYGFIGQAVNVFRYGDVGTECGRAAEASIADLTPITTRRLRDVTE